MELKLRLPTVRRAGAVAVLVAVLVSVDLGSSSPAAAHTRTQETTNVDSRITSTPPLEGVRWTVHTGGLLLEVENTGREPLIVHGYDGEPYLRIGPDGVQRNRRSPTTYLNDERFARQTRRDIVTRAPAMPVDVDPDAPPDWVHVRDEPRMLWHDHRTHWMSPQPPRFVEVGPLVRTMMAVRLVGPVGHAGDDAGVFSTWEVPVTSGGRTEVLGGELVWVDPPAAWPWLLTAAVLLLPGLLVGLRRVDGTPRLRPVAVMVAAVAATGVLTLVDDLRAWPNSPLDELSGLLHTTIFLLAGLAAAIWALLTRWGRPLALAIASGAVLYHQGLVHLPMLRASQFPTVWPDALVRLLVALALVQGIVVALVLLRARRSPRDHLPSAAQGQRPTAARDDAGSLVGR